MIKASVNVEYRGAPAQFRAEHKKLLKAVIIAATAYDSGTRHASSRTVGTTFMLTVDVDTNSPVRAEEVLDKILREIGFQFEEDREVMGDWVTGAREICSD